MKQHETHKPTSTERLARPEPAAGLGLAPFTLACGRGWKNGGYPWFVGLCLLLTTTCLLLADSSFRRRVA